jgi:diketogulonate reductase-like aldo/keto reductase
MVPTPRATVRSVPLPSGEAVPALGQGTWHLAEGVHPPAEEVAALRLGLDLGMTLVDTAEMYAGGAAEQLVGQAIAGRRDEVFLVYKVLPDHASRQRVVAACEASLRRLGTDHLDLYLLHWRGPIPLEETVAGFEHLLARGLIRHWGVSNFDLDDLEDLLATPGGEGVEEDQVLYNLTRRGIEWTVLPWCASRGMAITAYSPIDQGRLAGHPVLRGIAVRHRATSVQVALAWVLSHPGVRAIPRAGTEEHVRRNREALDLELSAADLVALDNAFPPPPGPRPLEVL